MRISPINNNNQINSKAVNQEYYQMAKKGFERGIGVSSEILRKLRYDVLWGDIHPKDGIDTIEAIKKLTGCTSEFTEHVLDNFRTMLKK